MLIGQLRSRSRSSLELVKQPILSLGKLVAGLNAQLKIGAEGGDVLQLDGMTFKVTRMLQSYYIPCYPMAPKDDYWVQQIGSTKMMTIGDGVVKYKQRMRVEPSKILIGRGEAGESCFSPTSSSEARTGATGAAESSCKEVG